jgi:tetratricopeptide (TPR) repeat protein
MPAVMAEMSRGRWVQRSRRVALGLTASVVAVVGAFGASAWQTAQGRAQCAEQGEAIARIWHDDARKALGARQDASSAPYAHHAVAHGVAVLDQYPAKWSLMRRELCEAAEVDHTLAPEIATPARECFEERAEIFEGVVAELTDEPLRVDLPYRVHGLPNLEDCANPRWLSGRPLRPESPGVREEIAQLRRRVAGRSGLPASDPEVDVLVAAADRIGWAPLQAEARHLLAKQMMTEVDFERGLELNGRALELAIAAGDLGTAAGAASCLAAIHARSNARDATQWGRLGVALGEQAGGSPITMVFHWGTLATIMHKQRDFFGAMAMLMAIIPTLESSVGPRTPEVATVYDQLALAFERAGSPAAAIELRGHGLAIMEDTVGPHHPDVAAMMLSAGHTQRREGRFADALASADAAVGILIENYGTLHHQVAMAHRLRGSSFLGLGMIDDAVAAYDESLAIIEATQGGDEVRVWVERDLSHAHLERGDVEAAIASAERALDLTRSADLQAYELAKSQRILGTALIRTATRATEGRALLAAARDVLDDSRPWADASHGVEERTESAPRRR